MTSPTTRSKSKAGGPEEEDKDTSLEKEVVSQQLHSLMVTGMSQVEAQKLLRSLKDQEKAADALRSWNYKLGALKSQITKGIASTQKLMEQKEAGQFSITSVPALRAAIQKLEGLKKELFDASVNRYLDLKGKGFEEDDINPTHELGKLEKNRNVTAVHVYLSDVDALAEEANLVIGRAEAASRIKPKSEEALKPKPLRLKSSAQAMEDFVRDLKAWFSASSYHLLPKATQKSSVINLMEGSLAHICNINYDAEKGPIFEADRKAGEVSLESIVRKQFLTSHPIAQRKMDVFKFRQDGYNERFAQLTARFLEQWKIAEWDDGNIEELKKYLFVSVVLNEKLKEKLIEAMNQNPAITLARLIVIGDTWELNHATLTASTPSANKKAKPVARPRVKAKAAQVVTKAAKGVVRGSFPRGRGNRRALPPSTKCYNCGNEGHNQSQCFLDASKVCSSCGKKGHYAKDCRQARRGAGRGTGFPRGRGRGSSLSATPGRGRGGRPPQRGRGRVQAAFVGAVRPVKVPPNWAPLTDRDWEIGYVDHEERDDDRSTYDSDSSWGQFEANRWLGDPEFDFSRAADFRDYNFDDTPADSEDGYGPEDRFGRWAAEAPDGGQEPCSYLETELQLQLAEAAAEQAQEPADQETADQETAGDQNIVMVKAIRMASWQGSEMWLGKQQNKINNRKNRKNREKEKEKEKKRAKKVEKAPRIVPKRPHLDAALKSTIKAYKACKSKDKTNFDVQELAGIPVVDSVKPTPSLSVSITPEIGSPFTLGASLPDTGAQITLIELSVATTHKMPLYETPYKLRGCNAKDYYKVMATCPIIITCGDKKVLVKEPLVMENMDKGEVMIDWQSLKALGAITFNFPEARAKAAKPSQLESSGVPQPLQPLVAKYSRVFSDSLEASRMLKGPPMHIHFKPGPVKPLYMTATKAIPLNLKKAADETIQNLERQTILKPIAPGENTVWCSRGFWVPKQDGKSVRLVTDFTHLNRYIQRPVHPFQAAYNCLMSIGANMTVFVAADAVQGYFQVPLDTVSSYYTTFLLPQGRFRYLRAPMGLSSSSDEWCARSDAAMQGIENALKLVDDILAWGPDETSALVTFELVAQGCARIGLTLSKKKLEIGPKVKFAGMWVSGKGVEPHESSVAAISLFPTPKNATDVRSFLGLAQFLARFLPDLTALSMRMRELTKSSIHFNWLPAHQEDFDKLKQILTGPLCVKHFNPEWATEVITDASRLHGLGFLVLQYDPKAPEPARRWLIMAGSRANTAAEKNYATIDLEMMAIVYAIEKASFYLLGCEHFEVKTDHKPLVGVFNKPLSEIQSLRQLRFRERLGIYRFTVSYLEGLKNLAADSLSRNPVNFSPGGEEEEDKAHMFIKKAMVQVDAAFAQLDATDPAFEFIREAIKHDDDYKAMVKAIQEDMTHPDNAPKAPKNHALTRLIPRSMWDHLEVMQGLLVYAPHRVVVPRAAVPRVLELLHMSHPGMVKCKNTARTLYWWKNMTVDIDNMTKSCNLCQINQDSKHAHATGEMAPPAGPMDRVHMDFGFLEGQAYLIIVDAYSGWPWCVKMTSRTSTAVIKVLKATFRDVGWPRTIRSDNDTCFTSEEFLDFCKNHHITPTTSSPYHHEGAGQSESMVKVMKQLLRKSANYEAFLDALMEYRVTKNEKGVSPSELFHGRIMRTKLPALPAVHMPISQADRKACEEKKRRGKKPFDPDHAEKVDKLSQFKHGSVVYVQTHLHQPKDKKWALGMVLDISCSGRSFLVQLEDGTSYRRNIRFIRLAPKATADEWKRKTLYMNIPDLVSAELEKKSVPPRDKAKSKRESNLHHQQLQLRRSNRLQKKAGQDKQQAVKVAFIAISRNLGNRKDDADTSLITLLGNARLVNHRETGGGGRSLNSFNLTSPRRRGAGLGQLAILAPGPIQDAAEPSITWSLLQGAFSGNGGKSSGEPFGKPYARAREHRKALSSGEPFGKPCAHFLEAQALLRGSGNRACPREGAEVNLLLKGFPHTQTSSLLIDIKTWQELGLLQVLDMGQIPNVPPSTYREALFREAHAMKPRKPSATDAPGIEESNFIHVKLASGGNITEDITMGMSASVPKADVKTKNAVLDQSSHAGYRLMDLSVEDATGFLGVGILVIGAVLICHFFHRCLCNGMPMSKAYSVIRGKKKKKALKATPPTDDEEMWTLPASAPPMPSPRPTARPVVRPKPNRLDVMEAGLEEEEPEPHPL